MAGRRRWGGDSGPRDVLLSSFCSLLPLQHILDWLIIDGAPLALVGATLSVRVMNLCYGD